MDRPDTPISGAGNLVKVVNGGPYPQVRIITSPGKTGWSQSTPDNLMTFSAQMQSFGLALQSDLKIPVGLMVAAVGGTPSARWVSYDALKADPEVQAALAKAGATLQDPREAAQAAAAQAAAPNPPPPPTTHVTSSAPPAPPAPRPAPKPRILIIGDLHDTILKPFLGYGMRGVLWDQGESGTAIKADQYQVMAVLIRSWRQEWNEGEFPFIFVQKPSGGGCSFDYSDPVYGWSGNLFTPLPPTVPGGGESRESFVRIAQNPNTFMVETSDLGDGIHPANKLAYGYRDAKVALGAVYHEPVEISGPVFRQAEVSGDKIRIHFSHVGKGLVFRNGDKLQGFALCGADRKWFWANAAIDGETVVVNSDQVPQPQFVRYAFAANYPWANLFNLDGFPALPFRTDPHP
jgi:sialate O-acetylesterase